MVKQKNEIHMGNKQICQFSMNWREWMLMNAGVVLDKNGGNPNLDFGANTALDSISSCKE